MVCDILKTVTMEKGEKVERKLPFWRRKVTLKLPYPGTWRKEVCLKK
jgi:hypothetical protein